MRNQTDVQEGAAPARTDASERRSRPVIAIVGLARAENTRIGLEPQVEGNRVLLDGMDVSRRIREGDVTSAASRISVHPRLRAWMVAEQRALGQAGGVV